MDTERNFILLNVINKLELVQCDSNTSLCITIYATLKEELKIIQNEDNKFFINDVCNFLVLSNSDNSSKHLKTLLKKLLIDKNNLEILNICHKIFKII
jgi:hypothetical protein